MDQVIDDNVYFCSEDYLNYIAPLYSYRVELLVIDYLNLENILMDLNENDIGFNSKLNIANKVDYTQHIMSLKSTQQNLMNLKSTFMILAIIMIGLLISFSGILVIKSYRLYTTLNSLYINMTKEKILTIIIGVGLSMALMLLMCDTLSNLINQTIFVEINKSLSDFPITAKAIFPLLKTGSLRAITSMPSGHTSEIIFSATEISKLSFSSSKRKSITSYSLEKPKESGKAKVMYG